MFKKIADYINTIPCRSAWRRGVRRASARRLVVA